LLARVVLGEGRTQIAEHDARIHRVAGFVAEKINERRKLFSPHSLQYLLPRKAKPETIILAFNPAGIGRTFDAPAKYY
jgi:hypothetical protein